MDLKDPNVIKSLIDSETQRLTEERLSHLNRTSASGQIRDLQGKMFDLAEGKLPAPVLGVARAGLEGVTQVLDKVFGLGPRETQIQTAKDMARSLAIDSVRRLQRQAEYAEREAFTKETLRREGVSSLAELRPITLRRRKERLQERLAREGVGSLAELRAKQRMGRR